MNKLSQAMAMTLIIILMMIGDEDRTENRLHQLTTFKVEQQADGYDRSPWIKGNSRNI